MILLRNKWNLKEMCGILSIKKYVLWPSALICPQNSHIRLLNGAVNSVLLIFCFHPKTYVHTQRQPEALYF